MQGDGYHEWSWCGYEVALWQWKAECVQRIVACVMCVIIIMCSRCGVYVGCLRTV